MPEKKTIIDEKKVVKAAEEQTVQTTFKGKYFYGTGSRKTAIARVRIYPGKGMLVINGKQVKEINEDIAGPLSLVGQNGKFDISVVVCGGGKNSQKDAIIHGISRALLEYNNELKSTLRKAGLLTRDPREKERKKPGLKRARRAPQWQKR